MRSACLFAFFGLSFAGFDYAGRPSLEDLDEFFKEDEKIWIYYRSYARYEGDDIHVCVYMQHHSWSYYHPGLRFVYGGYRTNKMGERIVLNIRQRRGNGTDDPPLLNITRDKDERPRDYQFMYWNKDEKCAVITFSDNLLARREHSTRI
ncbi:uncharacterized protein LOC119458348 isoform X2 [Dermacentor silvarum]|uniref:uncharacterized protein LOC119458348 isoform X2 n=1 Tax=Dermacentor silvarum TaxID=543639 RepID=UPI0021012CD6|nr:uncharacterized protein LOC119458348 isoform X2 [Dermacentor silvarum]